MKTARIIAGSLLFAVAACAPATEASVAASRDAADSSAPTEGGSQDGAGPGATPPASDVVDVRAEGALGDGTTDDSAAVQRALAKGLLLGRVVVFPAGRYRVESVVHLVLSASASLAIEGRDGATLVGAAAEPTDDKEIGVLDITGAGDDEASEVRIRQLAVELSQTERGFLNGIYLHGGMSRVTLDDVAARGASRWGIAVQRARSGTITNAHAEDNRYGGVGLEASANIALTGGVFSKNGTTPVVDGYGISCMSSVIGPCVNVTISGVHADSNMRKGIDVHSGHQITIDGNSVSGFESSGIYAVNEDPGKDVRDITITNNVVDGAGAAHYIYGIEIGAFSAASTISGNFTVSGNTIRNTSFTTSSAVMIRNPTAPGIAPVRVAVDHNTIVNGAAPDAYIIRGDNYDVPVGEIVITDNSLSAASAAVGIGLLRASIATVERNTIAIGAGTVAYGILVSAPASASIKGNALSGAASYSVPVAASASQVLRTNTLRGAALPNAN